MPAQLLTPAGAGAVSPSVAVWTRTALQCVNQYVNQYVIQKVSLTRHVACSATARSVTAVDCINMRMAQSSGGAFLPGNSVPVAELF